MLILTGTTNNSKAYSHTLSFNFEGVPEVREGDGSALLCPGDEIPGPVVLHLLALARFVPI